MHQNRVPGATNGAKPRSHSVWVHFGSVLGDYDAMLGGFGPILGGFWWILVDFGGFWVVRRRDPNDVHRGGKLLKKHHFAPRKVVLFEFWKGPRDAQGTQCRVGGGF